MSGGGGRRGAAPLGRAHAPCTPGITDAGNRPPYHQLMRRMRAEAGTSAMLPSAASSGGTGSVGPRVGVSGRQGSLPLAPFTPLLPDIRPPESTRTPTNAITTSHYLLPANHADAEPSMNAEQQEEGAEVLLDAWEEGAELPADLFDAHAIHPGSELILGYDPGLPGLPDQPHPWPACPEAGSLPEEDAYVLLGEQGDHLFPPGEAPDDDRAWVGGGPPLEHRWNNPYTLHLEAEQPAPAPGAEQSGGWASSFEQAYTQLPPRSRRAAASQRPTAPWQPALPAAAHAPGGNPSTHDRLRSVTEIPQPWRAIFPFAHFNRVQSACFDVVYLGDENVVVSSPTGSGKTGIMELAIARTLGSFSSNCKIIYIAPTRALCHERAMDWKRKFAPLHITCNALTGDSDGLQVRDIQASTIIVTTPEKWDTTTRKWTDSVKLLSLVRLLLIDEVHCLREPVRGATLEVIVARMKCRLDASLRILALSATCPNVEDIGEFLSPAATSPAAAVPARVLRFGPEYRPVPLEIIVLGAPDGGSAFTFDKNLDYRLNAIIHQYSPGKPVLVFCPTRKSAITAALQLSKEMTYSPGQSIHPFVPTPAAYGRLSTLQHQLSEAAQPVLNGIAYHHGGMSFQDRRAVEEAYLAGALRVICTTSTLAVGVNLPAHLVIIKSTQHWVDGKWREYPEMDIHQMIGRAGRPQFDDHGIAVILTTESRRDGYSEVLRGAQPIESTLHESLIEHLNAEIALKTITDADSAMRWLKSSFLYVRIRKNPGHYKLKGCTAVEGKLTAETRLEAICLKDLDFLTEQGFIALRTPELRLAPTEIGASVAKYYLRIPTGVHIMTLGPKSTLKRVLEVLCLASEFEEEVRFRMDKALLTNLSKSLGIRFKVPKIRTIAQKVNLLLQCCLGSVPLTEGSSSAQWTLETTAILKAAARVMKCIIDYLVERRDGASLLNALELQASIAAKCWEGSPHWCKQLDGIGPALAQALANAGLGTRSKILDADTGSLEGACNRNPPFGLRLQELARALPDFALDVVQHKDARCPTHVELQLKLRLTNPALCMAASSKSSKRGPLAYARVTLAVLLSDGQLLYHASLSLYALAKGEHIIRVPVTGLINSAQTVQVSVVSENVVGVGLTRTIVPDVSELAFKNARKRAPAASIKGVDASAGGRGKVARLAAGSLEDATTAAAAITAAAAAAPGEGGIQGEEADEFDAFFDLGEDAGELARIEAAALQSQPTAQREPVSVPRAPALPRSPAPRAGMSKEAKGAKPGLARARPRAARSIVALVPATPDIALIQGFGYTPGSAQTNDISSSTTTTMALTRSPTIRLDSSSSSDDLELLPSYAAPVRVAGKGARATGRMPLVREASVDDLEGTPLPPGPRAVSCESRALPASLHPALPSAPAPPLPQSVSAPIAGGPAAQPALEASETSKRRVRSAIQDALADLF